jgi:hypothetical protein
MDVADLGAGRWRLCLSEPVVLTVEGPAWCTWSDDRTAVREISGLPAGIGGGDSTVDGGIALDRDEVYVSSTDGGTVSSWEGSPSEPAPAAGDATRLGTTTFRIPAVVDEENPPAVRPPEAAGVISWQCGDAPPPRTGRA